MTAKGVVISICYMGVGAIWMGHDKFYHIFLGLQKQSGPFYGAMGNPVTNVIF